MTVQPIPAGYHTVTPYLAVRGAGDVLAFVKNAFDAVETECVKLPDGTVKHAEVEIGDSRVMIGEATKAGFAPMPACLYLYVEDAAAWFQRAVDAGAEVVDELQDHFYGDRSGGVKDPAGNHWYVATHIEDVTPEEMERRMAQMSRGGQE